jgi:hypothetical protein
MRFEIDRLKDGLRIGSSKNLFNKIIKALKTRLRQGGKS